MNAPTLHPRVLALAVALAFSAAASAQQAPTPPRPDIGDVLRQVQPPGVIEPKTPPLPSIGGAPIEPPMQALPGGASVQVDHFAIVGNHVIDTPTLLALVAPDQGKTLSLAELDAIATRITRHYRSAGYFVARAYVPAQDVTSGTLTLRVVEGNYGQFMLANHSRVRDSTVQGLLDDVKDRDIVSLDTIERAMLIINDTPGVKVVRADVMPGQKVGTSDFAISTDPTPAYDGYALLDNYGSRYTGRDRLSFNADWNSPTGRGDKLSLSGMATNRADLLNGRLDYSGLVATDGTRAGAAISRTRYELGDTYRSLDATGTADSLELYANHPIKRTRRLSVDSGLGLAYKALRDDVGATNTATAKRAATISANLAIRAEQPLFGADGLTLARVAVTLGQLHFNDAAAKALDAAGPNTQGTYAKLNLEASRTTSLPMDLTLNAGLRAQFSINGKNMDGSERLAISGPGVVVAYPAGESSGDHAALLHADLAHDLPPAGSLQTRASVFTDYGWAKAADPLPGASTRHLGDVGLGLSANTRGALLNLQLARRVAGGTPTSESVARTRLLVQAGVVF